jgi:GTP-binding protein
MQKITAKERYSRDTMENKGNKRPEAVFVGSSAHFRELPPPRGEEFAVMGRSNVGKSSFINHVLENKKLARVSKRPGRTTLANYYRVDERMVWVDLPGYGYAKAPGAEKLRWSRLIADYCERRPNISGIIWLVDCRHIGLKTDMEAWQWLNKLKLPLFMVLTKSDKIAQSMRKGAIRQAMTIFGLTEEPVLYSIQEHQSRLRFWESFNCWRQHLRQEK